MKKLLTFILIFLFAFCAPKKAKITPQLIESETKIKEADSLFKKGSYSCLKEALQAYKDLFPIKRFGKEAKEKFIKTALLLTLREKELGVLEYKSLEEASKLIQAASFLSEYLLDLDVVDSIPRKTKGFVTDFLMDTSRIDETHNRLKKNVPAWASRLKEKSLSDEFSAYLYISLVHNFPYYLGEAKPDFSRFSRVFSQSPSIRYILSFYPRENEESLNGIINTEPLFYEAHYFLGEIALRKGELITAEKNFLAVYEHIPESSSTVISLASIYFAFEDFKRSLELYEEALRLAPEYRDALLGKALCLSYSGRNQEAVEACQKLIAMGSFLMGESHYWLAWNQNELERLDEAWQSIENAKKYFVGNNDVLTLAGIIAFKRENLEEAEKNFDEALKLNPANSEAHFYTGSIHARKKDWKNSGLSYGRAAHCYERAEKALEERIKEIEESSFSEERKEKLVARKKAQLRKTALTKATSFYNGAAGCFNAGMKEEALHFARQAALHSSLKEKAEELSNKIKELK